MSKVCLSMLVGLFLMTANAQAHCGKCGVGDATHEGAGEMTKGEGCPIVGGKLEKLTKELSLTDEQKPQVEAILKEKMEKKQQIMDDKHKAMDALHADFETKLKGVLTEEQAQKWSAHKDSMAEHHGKCPDCKDGKMCEKCKGMKGHCPDCKDGQMCEKCKSMKGCPDCKDGKICDKCKSKKAHCPMCKDGKMCDHCKKMKADAEASQPATEGQGNMGSVQHN